MIPEGSQFESGSDGTPKHVTSEGVSDVTPKDMFANFTIHSADDGKVLMRGSQINNKSGRAHIEKQAGRHKVTWHN
ncbi:hypothetical protein UFOVP115_114 [uncultured Caudovirales phage]|uniref:Uncharacterized protein n=1 Tax=uncultured Caudovirales phage TaxID=2100421 RepID=A0A6J5L9P5_9CAUD|nr:hypothetical protein UFOVP115_114 [uncultured Caudovirales phage]